ITDGVISTRTLTIAGTTNQISLSTGAQTLAANRTWTVSLASNPVIPGTASLTLPIGATTSRPATPVNGMTRYNTTTTKFEFFENGAWVNYANNSGAVSGSGTTNYIPKFSSSSALNNSILYQTGTKMGVGTTNPSGRFMIQQDAAAADTEPIFEVKDKAGQTVMVIYKDSIHFYVKDDPSKAENKGAFAVSGKSSTKSLTNNLLLVNADSTRIYTTDSIAGFGAKNISGTTTTSYMQITPKNYFIGHEAGRALYTNPNNTGRYNIFMGYQSGRSNTSGINNVFLGFKSGYSNLSGIYNSYMGFESGYSSTSGNYNTFIGYQSGKTNTSGSDNTYLGYRAGSSNTTTGGNVFIGSKTGEYFTTGTQNVYMGESAGRYSTGSYNVLLGLEAGAGSSSYYNTGSRNNFMGYQAGYKNRGGYNNIFVGNSAGWSNTTGFKNIFMGDSSGYANTTGYYNSFMGIETGASNTTGNSNIFIGYKSGNTNLNGYSNIFIGRESGFSNYGGDNNVFLGSKAGYSNISGNKNVFLGFEAGYNNTASNNVFVGYYSGKNNSSGAFNTFLGYYAGYSNTIGGQNLFMGNQAGKNNTEGNSNVFLGDNSGYYNTTGNYNVFLGKDAGYTNDGNYNAFIGYNAGRSNSSGIQNTYLGYNAGFSNTTGERNVAIGDSAGYSATTAKNNVLIGSKAGGSLTTGGANVFIGENAGSSSTTSLAGVFIGQFAGKSNINSWFNVFIGYAAGMANTGGSLNTYVGMASGNESTGTGNSFFGGGTGQMNSGGNNTCMGIYAGQIGSGSYNTFIGNYAGQNYGVGSNNVFIGYEAGQNESGSNKLYIANSTTNPPLIYGDFSLKRIGLGTITPSYDLSFGGDATSYIGQERRTTSGSGYSFYIKSGGAYSGGTNLNGGSLYLDGGISTGSGSSSIYFRTTTAGLSGTTTRNPSTKMIITGNGDVGIGYTGPDAKLFVEGDAGSDAVRVRVGGATKLFVQSNGGTTIGTNTTAPDNGLYVFGQTKLYGSYSTTVGATYRDLYIDNTGLVGYVSSSLRYKKNITDMENVDWLYDIKPVNYNYKNDPSNTKEYGFIAEEVEKINPLFVSYNPDGSVETVQYSKFISPLLKAIQDQKKEIEELKTINNYKNSEIDKLKAEIEYIKAVINSSAKK
ncbi:MAG: hypothetical protein A2275_03240, partial [Bacteroidetes bacterium RIFOXYA12_FULL_35_11]